MIHKAGLLRLFSFIFLFALNNVDAWALRRTIVVVDSSSSGRLVRVNIGGSSGLMPGEPVLFSAGDKKIAAGRVVLANDETAVIAVLEKYTSENPTREYEYEILFGEPFDEAANLPDYVIDREEEEDNPDNERFLERDSKETTPELDDDSYTPEVSLRPKFPEPKSYNTHNLTIGLALFRNRSLPSSDDPTSLDQSRSTYSFYQGYTVRYAYSFQTNYWLRTRTLALISVEGIFGVYNFSHTFPDARIAQIRVVPLGGNLRYMVEVNRLFRLYPYVGYLYNVVGATNGNLSQLENIRGGRLFGGAGAQLVMSENVDARIEGGSDGVMGGLVVKF